MINIHQDLIDYCDQVTAGGAQLVLRWDGGDDSGSFYLELDNVNIPYGYWDSNPDKDPRAADLVNHLADVLAYGGFAGDFYTQGRIVYNRETKAFVGTDDFGTTEPVMKYDWGIEINIPKDLWFDAVSVEFEGSAGAISAHINILVDNGPVTAKHAERQRELIGIVEGRINSQSLEIDNFDFLYQEPLRINKSEFIETAEGWQYILDEMDYSGRVGELRSVEINLSE